MSTEIEDLENWHGKPIPKDRVDELLKDLEAEIQVPNKTLCPELPKEDTAPADLGPITLPSPPAYKKGDKVHLEKMSSMVNESYEVSHRHLVHVRSCKRPLLYSGLNSRPFPFPFKMATRRAYGVALAKLGQASQRVVALDGDTKNSTFSETFKKAFPDRYIECFIAEQNMVRSPPVFRGHLKYCSLTCEMVIISLHCPPWFHNLLQIGLICFYSLSSTII